MLPPVWRALRFDPPDGFRDDTVVTLVMEQGNKVVANLTVVGGAPQPALERYVEAQVVEARRAIAGYATVRQRAQTVAGMPAIVVEAAVTQKGGAAMYQFQAYVGGSDQLFIVTATSPGPYADSTRAAFERVLADLQRA
jgi:hypothetical protein